MSRYRDKPYTIHPRPMSSGKIVWYYQTYIDGKRTAPRSTGIGFNRERDRAKTRKQAEDELDRLFNAGHLGDTGKDPTLSAWIIRKHFWDWRKSEYVRGILLRSEKDKPGITESYVTTAGQITRDHILPYHGEKIITEITPFDCEQLLFQWAAGGVVNKTVNNWKSVYSTILGEYEREQKMRNPGSACYNPWRLVDPLKASKNSYGAVAISEAARLLSPEGIDFEKPRNRLYYLATKLAFVTGMRIGEVCGLLASDVIDVEFPKEAETVRMSYLHVTHTYNPKTQTRGLVKDKEARDIPITAELREDLDDYIRAGKRKGAYLFSFDPEHKAAISASGLRTWMYGRMDDVGVKDRQGRRIVFHSTRRFFNTILGLNGVPDKIIQKFTGHNSASMTEHYTDYLPEDLQVISAAQRKLLEGRIKE